MAGGERPILKLKLPKSAGAKEPTVPPANKKLKLNFSALKKAQVQEPAATASPSGTGPKKIVFKSKKPAAASLAGKKREHDGDQTPASAGPKRIKFTSKKAAAVKTPTTPFIKLKAKGRPPVRPMGIGYDSEASDAEKDPHIEEEFILRMQPGDDCDYVRDAIANKKIGIAMRDGGADIRLKFMRQDGRRAILHVCGNMYAASMVDLPCIVEGHKSWDKKGWWKTADISQMLLVLGPVKSEEEAQSMPLPKNDVREGTFMYEHGLTPPMKWVRKRRFRKRVSTNIVMQVEQAVEDLFRRDAEAIGSRYEIFDNQRQYQEQVQAEMNIGAGGEYEDEMLEDAFGEEDDDIQYEGQLEEQFEGEEEEEEEHQADWDAMLEDVYGDEVDDSEAPTPIAHVEAHPANTDSDAATPGGITAVIDGDDEAETPMPQEEESGSDADEASSDEDAGDGRNAEERTEEKAKHDEIAILEEAIASKRAGLHPTNKVLRKKQEESLRSMENELATKKAALGIVDDDDE